MNSIMEACYRSLLSSSVHIKARDDCVLWNNTIWWDKRTNAWFDEEEAGVNTFYIFLYRYAVDKE